MIGIIVVGPESTGTRMTTRICIAQGALGTDAHVQHWDGAPDRDLGSPRIPQATNKPLVWRRSIPHGPKMSDLAMMSKAMKAKGYTDIRVIVTTRDWIPQTKSMYKNHMECRGKKGQCPEKRTQKAYLHIFKELARTQFPFMVTNYECLCTDINSMNYMLEFVGLPKLTPQQYAAQNLKIANGKWYAQS